MPRVPDGPVAIEIIENNPGAIRFRFTSFPNKFRDVGSLDYPWHKVRIQNEARMSSIAATPEVINEPNSTLALYGPSTSRAEDDMILVWPKSLSLLCQLVTLANKVIAGDNWNRLRERVRAYQRRISCEKQNGS